MIESLCDLNKTFCQELDDEYILEKKIICIKEQNNQFHTCVDLDSTWLVNFKFTSNCCTDFSMSLMNKVIESIDGKFLKAHLDTSIKDQHIPTAWF